MFASVVLFVVLTRCAIDEINGVVQLRLAKSYCNICVGKSDLCVTLPRAIPPRNRSKPMCPSKSRSLDVHVWSVGPCLDPAAQK